MNLSRSRVLVVPALLLVAAGPLRGEARPEEKPGGPSASAPGPAALTPPEAVRGLIRHDHNEDAERMARELLLTAESTQGRKSLEAAEAIDVLVEALTGGGKAGSAEVVELADRAISIREKALGPNAPNLSTSLAAKGNLLKARGSYAQALPFLERALALRERAYGTDDLRVGQAHNDLAALLLETDLDASETHSREALRIFQATSGPNSIETSDALDVLSVCATDLGRFAEAEELGRRSLRISEDVLGPRSSHAALRHHHLGGSYIVTGDYERAREELEQAASITEEVLGARHPSLVRPLANLAIAEDLLGIPAAAHYERAIALADETMGPDHDVPARVRANYAGYLGDSDILKSRRLLEQALAVLSRTLGPAHPQSLWVTSGLADSAALVGDFPAAERYYEQAITGLEQSADAPSEFLVSALAGLASCRAETGRTAEARALYERALALGEKELGPDHFRVAEILVALGNVLRQQGKLGEAESAYSRSLKIREKALSNSDPAVIETLFALADLKTEKGQLQEAQVLFRRAIAIQEKTRAPNDLRNADGYRKYASFLLRSGSPRAALDAAIKAESISRRHLRSTVASLSERNALSLVAKIPSGLDLAISAATALREPASAKVALDAVVRSRALVLDEMGQRHQTVRAAGDPELSSLFADYAAAKARLANLTVKGEDEKSPEKSRKRLEEARTAKEVAERRLAEKSAEFGRTRAQAGAGFAEVARALPEGGALVAFVRYARHAAIDRSKRNPKPAPPVDSYAAFVLRRGSAAPVLVSLAPASAVDAQVALVRKALGEAAVAAGSASGFAEISYRRAAAVLRDLVWKSLKPHLGTAKNVFLVPDGSLQLVSFAALPEGTDRYLVESGPVLHYLSAERDLVSPALSPGAGLMAAGAPAFDERPLAVPARQADASTRRPPTAVAAAVFRGALSTCRSFDSLKFSDLPSARQEVEEVAAAWRASATRVRGVSRPDGPGSEPLVFSGAAASETAVKTNAPGRRVLHLATHGFFLGDCPSSSGIEAAKPPRAATVFAENPLLLSGIAFAGANQRGAAGSGVDDGILTAEEIATLDLSGVEWAVLSACETGVGELRSGEGLFGLRRAFQVAGARSLILSLWPVEDEASRQWMQALYRNRLARGMTTARSVHAASLGELLKRRASGLSTHPFYWAGFVATGDWR